MKKCVIGLIVGLVAIVGGIFVIKSAEVIPTGKVGVQYSYNQGVKDEVLNSGLNFVSPFVKVKEFSIGNEQLILSKDAREGSPEDDSFKVATADNANISISFQMSYRYNPATVVETYKKFKGMDGEDIVEQRVKTVLKSKISEITTNYSLMQLYSGNRSEINNKLTEYLNKEFSEAYGIEVLDASVIDVHPDEALTASIDNRVKALQEKEQAEAEQEKIKVQKATEQMQAEADAQIAITKANAEAEQIRIKAQAEADANRELASSINQNLIDMEIAKAHKQHGFVTIQGGSPIVDTRE